MKIRFILRWSEVEFKIINVSIKRTIYFRTYHYHTRRNWILSRVKKQHFKQFYFKFLRSYWGYRQSIILLKHQFFVINRKNLIETLDWDEVHQIQQSYINRKTELLQQKELKERKIQIIESILSERGYNRNNRNL